MGDSRVEQTLRNLLEHARLDAARACLGGAGPSGVIEADRLGGGRCEEDELGLDTDEERHPGAVVCFPAGGGCVSARTTLKKEIRGVIAPFWT